MAFELKAGFCEDSDCLSFRLYDLSGVYNATTNPTGYGTPNIGTSDVTLCYLYYKLPGETAFNTPIEITATLPSSNVADYVTILNTDLGLGAEDKLPDGYYVFKYEIQGTFGGDPFTYSVTHTVLFSCQVACCVKEATAKIRVNCNCDDSDNDKYKAMYFAYISMLGADNCGNKEGAQAILNQLKKECNCSTCNDC